MTACQCCQRARDYAAHPYFSLGCVHCGARLIQHLGTLQIAWSQCSARRTAALRDWVQWGHSEAEIRALVKGPLALAPLPEPVSEPKKRSRK